MNSPSLRDNKSQKSHNQDAKPGTQVYREICNELGKNPCSAIVHGMHNKSLVLKVDVLMAGEMKSLKLLMERHQFHKIAIYKDTPELGDLFDPKTGSLKPKYANKSPQFSMTQKSFSRLSNSLRPKSPQCNRIKTDQKKGKVLQAHENFPLFCKFLIPQLSTSNTLEALKLFFINFTKEALSSLAIGIKENQTLKELSICYCELTTEEFEVIYGAIAENNNLNLVDLSHNQLDDNAGRMLGNIVGVHGRKRDEILWVYSIRGDQPEEDPELKGICELNVSFNQLGSRALKDMCNSLKYDTWFKNLNVRGNQIGEDGIIALKQLLDNNNSILAIDLRENPFYNPRLSREIITKLATNIQNYKEKNMLLPSEEPSQHQGIEGDVYEDHHHYDNQIYVDSRGQVFQGLGGQVGDSGTFDMQIGSDNHQQNPVINEEIEELIKKYEVKGSPEEDTKENEIDRKLEGVSFGFRNEKIKENLRKDYKKLRPKHTRSEGRKNMVSDQGNSGGEGQCLGCKQLEKRLLLSESRSVNLLLENYKLKKKLNAILQAQNSWSAISPQFNEMENTSNIPHPESISQDLFKKNTTLGDQPIPDSEEVFNRIENLMAELTRMMDNLENVNATNNFTGHFTNSTHLTNNNTYQLINSANNINFTSTTHILNSNNNSRVHALAGQNLQQTISMHQGNNRDVSKSFSRVHQQKNAQHLNNYSEQNALTPHDKSDNQESKAISQFSLFFQNENSHMNYSHS